MKLCELKIISQKLAQYKKIHSIIRVADTIIKIEFDKDEPIYINLQRGDSYIFKSDEFIRSKNYTAPFDIVLQKRFTNAKITKIEVPKEDKLLKIHTISSSKYKSQESILQFEFTGRHTNAIILDHDYTILEALRHIDISNSYREIKVGVKLLDLPKREFQFKPCEIDDIDLFLKNEHLTRQKRKLQELKKLKTKQIQKKIDTLKKALNSLEDEETLLKKAQQTEFEAGLILANLNIIKPYQKLISLKDYEGNDLSIELPKEANSASLGANMLYKKAKKLKQKAKNLHIERDNLKGKITFLERLSKIIEDAKSSQEIDLYLPKQPKKQKNRNSQNTNVEYFFFKDHKIGVGKNQNGNIFLLKDAKMSDIWLHLKDIPSTHVIIRTNKSKIDDEVLEFAAKLCVNFSTSSKGDYLVDYTSRRNLKVREGAKVNYTNYKSLKIRKD